MDIATFIGLAAGFLTTASLVPQVLKIWKTRSAKDVSRKMFIAFCTGVALWLVYGILQEEPPMILWNAISLVLGLGILGMKIKYG
jgi:MtN3 and saliva related transmembrane protein